MARLQDDINADYCIEAWIAGRDMGLIREPQTVNPHSLGTPEYDAWLFGWIYGMKNATPTAS